MRKEKGRQMNDNTNKKIGVVGLGYIGLPTAIIAAEVGFQVFGFDIDKKRISSINEGKSSIKEPELPERLKAIVENKKLEAFNRLKSADIFILAVPTPFKDGKKADLTALFAAGKNIADVLRPGNLIIIESTIPVGTTDCFAQLLAELSGLEAHKDFFVAHCPERVLPGKIFEELVKNDRVIGGIGKLAGKMAHEFYSSFVTGTLYVTDDKVAEMVKLVENSSRDVDIAFANQLGEMCEEANINVHDVIKLANKHPRVNLLSPGCGVGGHCIAVDPWFLIESFPKSTTLLKMARDINDFKPYKVIDRVMELVQRFSKDTNKKPNTLILGLTFKPNIDDVRQSPALQIAHELAKKKNILDLYICEPNLSDKEIYSHGFLSAVKLWESLKLADIVVILVKHAFFEKIMPKDLLGKLLVDACGITDTFSYKSKISQVPPLKKTNFTDGNII